MKRNFSQDMRAQRGVALFVALFLITATAGLAAVVALTTGTQQLGSARALQAEQAYYAALGRLESELPAAISSGDCPVAGMQNIAGFTTEIDCIAETVNEDGNEYQVLTLSATAERGSQSASTRVRRTVSVQVTNPD